MSREKIKKFLVWMRNGVSIAYTWLALLLLIFSVYEGVCFYLFGLFHGEGSFLQWLIFAEIIVILYFLCIGIFRIYSRKKAVEYTKALQRYQQKQI